MKKICIDPGHGGTDRSNKGTQGYIEADGNLEFSKALKDALAKYDCQVIMTRDSDKSVALKDRGQKAKGCDLFLSVHSNAGGGTGTSVFYSIRQKENATHAQRLCEDVAGYFKKRARGAKYRESTNSKGYDYYTVIFYAEKVGCPHVYLLERLFHDNKEEELMLLDKAKTKESAAVVAKWIAEVLDLEEKKPTATTPAASKYKTGIYQVTCGSLNRRTKPDPDSKIAGSALHKGDQLNVTKVENGAWGYAENLKAWVNVSDIYCKYLGTAVSVKKVPKVDDLVHVKGSLYSNKNADGNSVKVDRDLYIVRIYASGKAPIAFSKTKGGTVYGFGSEEVLK